MSVLVSRDVPCPYCKHPNEAEVWSSINVREDPELKDILIGGELNMTTCSSCREVFYVDHFLLYHDPESELMAFVYPRDAAAEKEVWEAKTASDFAESQATIPEGDRLPYPPATFFGLDELVRLVEREDEMNLQGEIVAALAPAHGFGIRRLRALDARSGGWPRILPVMNGRDSARESLAAGLRKLKDVNDRLFVYNELAERLEREPALVPPAGGERA